MAIPTNIKNLLSGNVVEWARIEFKATWDPAASLKSVCAFANDLDNWGGGYIVIGVEGVRVEKRAHILQSGGAVRFEHRPHPELSERS